MLIIHSINVFLSKVEHIPTQISEAKHQYMIVVDKKHVLDEMAIQVKIKPKAVSNKMSEVKILNVSVKAD